MADTPNAPFESRMMIDGKLVDGEAGTFTNINPANEDVLGEVADASKADMNRAIDAARRIVRRDRLVDQSPTAQTLPRTTARRDRERTGGVARGAHPGGRLPAGGHVRRAVWMPRCEDGLKYPARLIDTFPWETDLGDAFVSLTGGNTRRKVWHEPVGVVGAIVPWNFPFEVTINKLAQALATGNTVVLKPAPNTPFNATRLGRLIAEKTDIPAGVVNVVTASDHFVGEELTLSPKVDMISFTGSTVVGKRIMEKGAATMKRLFLELGGKSATIVLEDADFNTACLIGIGPLMHAGQGCAAPTRMLLPRSRYDEGVAILKGIYENIAAGDPQDPGTLCGPVISAKQQARILGYIQQGCRRGSDDARREHGGAEGVRQGILGQPNAFHRCRQLDDDRAGGDLRSCARRHSLRGRGRRGADRQ